jgi:hypothetical protein
MNKELEEIVAKIERENAVEIAQRDIAALEYERKIYRGEVPMPIFPPFRIPIQFKGK